MKKIQIYLFLIFQFLFLVNLFSQTQNNRFILAWYDYSTIQTSLNTISQRFKNLQTHNFNCVIMDFRLVHLNNLVLDSINFQYAYKNPSKNFMDTAHRYNLKVILNTPDNCLIRSKENYLTQYDSIISRQGLEYWGNHPALLGFSVRDEPTCYDINKIVPYVNDIRTFNPNLLHYITVVPSCNWKFNYGACLQTYLNSVQPNFLSFDYYALDLQYSLYDFFSELDTLSRISVE